MKFCGIQAALFAAILIGLTGCRTNPAPPIAGAHNAAAPPVFDAQTYRQLDSGAGEVFWIDDRNSEVRLFLWRAGPLAAEGHNHVLVVNRMEGALYLPSDLLSGAVRLDIVFQAADITVDPPALRRRIGGAWAKIIPPEGVRGTRDNMLGPDALDAQRFPAIGLHAEQVYGELPKLAIEAAVTLHGVVQRGLIPVTVTRDEGRLRARGSFLIRQTAFDIEPFSAMGGALSVHDPILIEFDLQARRP